MSNRPWLYRTEARSIGAYVLSHRKLRHMLGASAIVRELVERELDRVLEGSGTIIAHAAGGATVRFEHDDDLKRFIGRWPQAVAEFAPGLAVVQGWVEDGPDPMRRLAQVMAEARRRPAVLGPTTSPVVDVSWRGLPVAWQVGEEPVDLATRAADVAAKHRGAYDRDLLEDADLGGCEMPTDIPELAGEHDIAVIHADGNGVGKKVQDLKTLPEIQAFSEQLAAAGRAALVGALHTLKPSRGKWLLGVEIVSGGDDLSMIVRADRALDFLRAYADRFEKETAGRKAVGRLTLSAGVAFVRANHAFHLAHELASGLCDAAKVGGRANQQSVVRFQRFTSLATEAVSAPELAAPALAWKAYRLAGAAGDAHVDALQRAVRAAKTLPRGPVRGMLETMAEEVAAGDASGARAQKQWDRILDVQQALQGEKKLAGIRRSLDAVAPGLGDRPWLPTGEGPRSPWSDLLALVAVGEGSDA